MSVIDTDELVIVNRRTYCYWSAFCGCTRNNVADGPTVTYYCFVLVWSSLTIWLTCLVTLSWIITCWLYSVHLLQLFV